MKEDYAFIADGVVAAGAIAAIVEYTLMPGARMADLVREIREAATWLAASAREFGGDGNKLSASGHSAGGHLASTAATHFDDGNAAADDPLDQLNCRPDFAVLVYPVVTMGEKTHGGSRTNLLGSNPTPEMIELFSNEKQVTEKTPPIFLTHAVDDTPVPCENSKALYEALQNAGIASKYLELPSGGHGLNGYKGPMWDAWQKQSLEWMAELKLIPTAVE